MKRLLTLQVSTWTTLLLTISLSGCITIGNRPVSPSAKHPDPLSPAREQVVGFVSSVDPVKQIALVELHSASTRTGSLLITRNATLTETARLEPTRFQRGRTLGTRILSGLPNPGDEVISE